MDGGQGVAARRTGVTADGSRIWAMAGESWLRRNAFIVAAVLLPVVVVGLFLIASAAPRWRVPDPQFDLGFA